MTQEDVETFAKGIPLKDFTCQPARLELVSIDTGKESKPGSCDHCRREVSSGQAYGGLLWQGSGGLATFDYGNFSLG